MKIQRRRSVARRVSTDSRSDTAYWHKSRSKSPPILSKGTTMFVKMPDSNAYFPINVRKKTIRHLLEAIHLKCPSFLPYLGMFRFFDYHVIMYLHPNCNILR